MIVLFRSRLRSEGREEYTAVAEEMETLAKQQPGIVAFKTFTAEDGERVTLAEFESSAAVDAWREHTAHRAAQRAGRERFYSEYRLQVCEAVRDYDFVRSDDNDSDGG